MIVLSYVAFTAVSKAPGRNLKITWSWVEIELKHHLILLRLHSPPLSAVLSQYSSSFNPAAHLKGSKSSPPERLLQPFAPSSHTEIEKPLSRVHDDKPSRLSLTIHLKAAWSLGPVINSVQQRWKGWHVTAGKSHSGSLITITFPIRCLSNSQNKQALEIEESWEQVCSKRCPAVTSDTSPVQLDHKAAFLSLESYWPVLFICSRSFLDSS